MARYAQGTQVPVSQSMAEVQKLMARFGVPAQDFMQVSRGDRYACWWKLGGHTFSAEVTGQKDQRELRRKWRVIVNHIKAQLISVEEGLIGKEEALLPFLMLPDGRAYAPVLRAQLRDASQSGRVADFPALPVAIAT